MTWHVQSTLALDLSGISPDILNNLSSKPVKNLPYSAT